MAFSHVNEAAIPSGHNPDEEGTICRLYFRLFTAYTADLSGSSKSAELRIRQDKPYIRPDG